MYCAEVTVIHSRHGLCVCMWVEGAAIYGFQIQFPACLSHVEPMHSQQTKDLFEK